MSVTHHTNGTAGILVNSYALGLSNSDGVELAFTEYTNPINSDERGPNIPAEVLRNGSDARITFELWKYDSAIWASFMAQRMGGTFGQMGQIGQMMFANNLTSAIQIQSPVDNEIFTFNRTMIDGEATVMLSTQLKIWKVVIWAVPDASGVLCTRTSA